MKRITILFVCIMLSAHLFAQNLQFGLRINPEFSVLLNKTDMNAGGEINYEKTFCYASFGVGGAYNLNSHLGVGVDILFSREGQNFSGDMGVSSLDSNGYNAIVLLQAFLNNDTTVTGEYEAKAEPNFIKIPLMLKLATDNTKSFYLDAFIGPQFNILQGVAQEVNGSDYEYTGTDITPFDIYKGLTLDGVLGLGIGCNLSDHFLISAHLRFDYGFGDLENKDLQVSYLGGASTNFFTSGRAATHNATGGLLIGFDYRL